MTVRTVQPSADVKPPLRMNVLKVIEEHVPYRLAEIEGEMLELEKQIRTLADERLKLVKIQEAVK